jgi:hypothetical protein
VITKILIVVGVALGSSAGAEVRIAASSNRPTGHRYREDLRTRANPGEDCGRGAGWSETNEELAIARDRVAVIS